MGGRGTVSSFGRGAAIRVNSGNITVNGIGGVFSFLGRAIIAGTGSNVTLNGGVLFAAGVNIGLAGVYSTVIPITFGPNRGMIVAWSAPYEPPSDEYRFVYRMGTSDHLLIHGNVGTAEWSRNVHGESGILFKHGNLREFVNLDGFVRVTDNGDSSCNVGFGFFVLALMAVPFILRKKIAKLPS